LAGAPGYYPVAARARHYDHRPAQHRVQCPIMLINGTEDSWVPIADIEHLRDAAPVTYDIRICPARHLLNIEWPALFNHLVTDFLNEDCRFGGIFRGRAPGRSWVSFHG
jgi:pimeloyl-ACP methyl ester carboxylesterase